MSKDQEIRELFKQHNVQLDRDDVWAVHGNPVVRHKALERLAASIGIAWDTPRFIRSERDEAVIFVAGSSAEGAWEWSIGEACLGVNYKAPGGQAYVYAMAEKRGKDRVILKLAGLHGVYSEEEADDFRQGAPEPSQAAPDKPKTQDAVRQQSEAKPAPKPAKEAQMPPDLGYDPRASVGTARPSSSSREIYVDNSIERIRGFEKASELFKWAKTERADVWPQYGIDPMDEDGQRIVRVYKERMVELERMPA
jgi:hypothetical protein